MRSRFDPSAFIAAEPASRESQTVAAAATWPLLLPKLAENRALEYLSY
jgi:hypothetical protein